MPEGASGRLDAETAHAEANYIQGEARTLGMAPSAVEPRGSNYEWAAGRYQADPERVIKEVQEAREKIAQMKQEYLDRMRAIRGEGFDQVQEARQFDNNPEYYVLRTGFLEASNELTRVVGNKERAHQLLKRVSDQANEIRRGRHEGEWIGDRVTPRVTAAAVAINELTDSRYVKGIPSAEVIGQLTLTYQAQARLEAYDDQAWQEQRDVEEELGAARRRAEWQDSMPDFSLRALGQEVWRAIRPRVSPKETAPSA